MYILAPEKHKNFAAFTVGTLNVIGWWIVTCAGMSLGTVSTFGMVTFWIPSFQATQWQTYLLFDLGIILTRKTLSDPVVETKLRQRQSYLSSQSPIDTWEN